MSTDFTPGAYWTPERARAAATSVSEQLASPQMQAFMNEVAAAGADPAATTAQMAAAGTTRPASSTPVRADACHYRRGRAADIPAFAQLIIAGDLPPLFIQEFVEGFVAVEHDGEISWMRRTRDLRRFRRHPQHRRRPSAPVDRTSPRR